LRFQAIVSGVVCAAALALAMPNFFSRSAVSDWLDWLPQRQLKFGLEFTGGTSLLLKPDFKFAARDAAKSIRDRVRQTLRDNRVRYEDLRYAAGTEVKFRISEPGAANRAIHLLTHEAALWYGAPGTRPAIAIRSAADGEVTLRLSEPGVRILHRRLVENGVLRLHRQMRCLGIDDYRIIKDRDRVLLTTRQPFGTTALDGRCYHL